MSSEATAIRDLERSWNSTASLFTWRSAALAGVLFFLIYYYKWEFNDLAWALWINMIWTGIALIIANAVLTLFDVLDRSHPVRFVFGFVFAFVPLFFASGVIGSLLSFLAENEPKSLLGRNGFINADLNEVLVHTTFRYMPALALAGTELLFALRLAFLSRIAPIARVRSYFGKFIGALVFSCVVGVFISARFGIDTARYGMLLCFTTWFVFPWHLITRDFIQDQMEERRPQLYGGVDLPLIINDRASSFLIIIPFVMLLLFGGAAATCLVFGLRKLTTSTWHNQGLVSIFAGIVLLALTLWIGLVVVSLSLYISRVVISSRDVTIERRAYWASKKTSFLDRVKTMFRKDNLRIPLSEYLNIEHKIERKYRSKRPSYDEHTLVLNHNEDREKDVVIYKAVHGEHIYLFTKHYTKLLRVTVKGPFT